MEVFISQLPFVLSAVIFSTVVLLHLVRKNYTVVSLYIIQSCAVLGLLLLASGGHFSLLLALAVLATVLVKIFVGPYFLFNLIKQHQLTFSSSTYLSVPFTLVVVSLLTALTQTKFFAPLALLNVGGERLILIAIATVLISLFLVVNRKGMLSQMIGILSFENGIVAFALFSGLEQSPGLQIGISFNIMLWIIIATVFISMIYKQFGSLDVSSIKKLTE